VLPSGLSVISENAFEGGVSLTYIIAPTSLTSVESSAFRECESFKTVYYYGTEQSFDEIAIDLSYNSAIIDADLYFYSEAAPEEMGSYWYYDERGNIRLWK
jgi:hypothetical protein